jgi:hypothetical protein
VSFCVLSKHHLLTLMTIVSPSDDCPMSMNAQPPTYASTDLNPMVDGGYQPATPLPGAGYQPTQPAAGGYTPVQYRTESTTSAFWGKSVIPALCVLESTSDSSSRLIDSKQEPSLVFCRLADAIFFLMDSRGSENANTGFIDLPKFVWLWIQTGAIPANYVSLFNNSLFWLTYVLG